MEYAGEVVIWIVTQKWGIGTCRFPFFVQILYDYLYRICNFLYLLVYQKVTFKNAMMATKIVVPLHRQSDKEALTVRPRVAVNDVNRAKVLVKEVIDVK